MVRHEREAVAYVDLVAAIFEHIASAAQSAEVIVPGSALALAVANLFHQGSQNTTTAAQHDAFMRLARCAGTFVTASDQVLGLEVPFLVYNFLYRSMVSGHEVDYGLLWVLVERKPVLLQLFASHAEVICNHLAHRPNLLLLVCGGDDQNLASTFVRCFLERHANLFDVTNMLHMLRFFLAHTHFAPMREESSRCLNMIIDDPPCVLGCPMHEVASLLMAVLDSGQPSLISLTFCSTGPHLTQSRVFGRLLLTSLVFYYQNPQFANRDMVVLFRKVFSVVTRPPILPSIVEYLQQCFHKYTGQKHGVTATVPLPEHLAAFTSMREMPPHFVLTHSNLALFPQLLQLLATSV